MLGGDVLQFLTQVDETDSINGIASPGHCSECQHILLHFRSSLGKLVDGLLDGLMQFFFVQCGGVMAVFRSKFQPGDAPPNDPLFSVPGPGHPLIGRSALPAHQQLGEGVFGRVFAQLRLASFLHHLPLAGPSGHLLLYPVEQLPGDDGGVVVLHIALAPLSVVLLHPFADAIGDKGFAQHGVPNVTLVGEDVADHLIRPPLNSLGSGDTVRLQLLLDLGQATSIQVPPIDAPHCLCLLRFDLRLSV